MLLDFIDDLGAIPDDSSREICRRNTEILSHALQYNVTNNRLRIPHGKVFHLTNGVHAHRIHDAVIQLDGTLRFERFAERLNCDRPLPACIAIGRSHNLTITSTHRGVIDGRGSQYWGVPMVGYLEVAECRPRLLEIDRPTNLLMENIILQDSPYHTLKLSSVNGVEIRNISIVARRTRYDGHGWVDLSAFNTDGIDVSGHNVHVHDVDIWTQDDCIAVKDNYDPASGFISSNMTFERVNASGMGFVIGSIGGSTVRNITFRDSYLHRTVKGIYLKFRKPTDDIFVEHNASGLIEDIVFENISMEEPLQFSLFLGPAQQSDTRDVCFANPCSLCWPWSPTAKCHVVHQSQFKNITLRNIQINNPRMSPGVILGNELYPMEGLVFDNVRVTKGKILPHASGDRTTIFPGLKQSIDDKYVPNRIFSHQLPQWLTRDKYPERSMLTVRSDSKNSSNGLLALAAIVFFLNLAVCMRTRFFPPGKNGKSVSTTHILLQQQPEQQQQQQQQPEQQRRKLLTWVRGILSLLCLFMVLFASLRMLSNPFSLELKKPKWERTSSYFRCEGANGIALGETWPVPDCFQQHHDTSYSSSSSSGHD